jgi:hypothetical protein
LAEHLLFLTLRFFVTRLGNGSPLLGSFNPRLAPILLQELPIWPLNAGERRSDLAAGSWIACFVGGADAKIIGGLRLPARAHPRYRAEVVDSRIRRTRGDDLRKLLLGLSNLACEVVMHAAAINLGHVS